ncbi:MAG: Cell division protein ftsA [Candidatus Falkowbacteria bacterium GW2011_GWC2_38_22]|uniref:Cell division protein FtsA n=1 Tax=Candidatus Falkowbacteria bacterium GW2011_GWE1_38_31 TaxID=1618638 RepID=A0A0G0JQQ7_9BACT|nr:MAG: Cell division protein ftsA [Candidatus Falkowbacteria bacterium GW2011_GWF2_38_1205]KKQ61283.1 MAG: Cell division protein ftsA [Candidatus Falkowbacteria bacterium GW2011_GWC2_38_22]KKQ63145.1 MAG: Cell division protein ftsA [Candidatus Falkowbacteria bacterium GW2011_GWF1_38_22]KKQ65342.1 MAG: Cell division protein ftsA [Candidatus Falkowbacteria bacterium GW2011_GWE2_38_254]KKQ69918.1 MAG: Cell division protein ftsA [Candidatus Falkowbacteria bacterium GW2011_GWE1_38_31]KKQ72482.1 MA
MKDNIIAGLDIGSTEVRLVVAQHKNTGEGEELQIIGAIKAPSNGINKGAVKSIEDVTSSISACLEKAERLVGVPIDSVWVSINSPYIKCEKSRGVVAVSKGDGEISQEDVARALEAAQALSVPPNYEILHVIPVKFTVDNQGDIKDPVGMTGVRLEVETLIIQGLSSQIKNLTKAIFRTNLDIEDLVLSPLAAAEAVIGAKQKELGAALVNIGASTTSLAVFEEGELLHTAVIPIGSDHITADVAIGLRCPINFADRVKKEYGSAVPSNLDKNEEIDVSEIAKEEGVADEITTVNKKYLAEIIEARVEEIFEKVDQEFKKIERSGMLPGGVFLIGGGTKLANIIEAGKKKLRLPVSLGTNKKIATIIDKVNDTEYLNALGLIIWGDNLSSVSSSKTGKFAAKLDMSKGVDQVKKWFKALMP